MTEDEIVTQVLSKKQSFRWVVISGGNPLLWDLTILVRKLHDLGLRVAVETQGTVANTWIRDVDFVVISPKPPSSGMFTTEIGLRIFIESLGSKVRSALKIVAFNPVDVDFAEEVHSWFPRRLMYLSCGTFAPGTPFSVMANDSTDDILRRTRNLITDVSGRPSLSDVRILPQIHVLLWGHRLGV